MRRRQLLAAALVAACFALPETARPATILPPLVGSAVGSALSFLTPTGGDDTAMLNAAFARGGHVGLLPGDTYYVSGTVTWNPITTTVYADDATINASGIARPSQIAAGTDAVNFATVLPAAEAGATVARQGNGSVTISGGKAYYYFRLPSGVNNLSLTFTTSSSVVFNRYKNGPTGAPQYTTGALTSQTFAYATTNTGLNTYPIFWEIDATAGPVNVTAFTFTNAAVYQPYVGAIQVNCTGSALYGHDANPWHGGIFTGNDVFGVCAFKVETPVTPTGNPGQSSRFVRVGGYVNNFQVGDFYGDNAYACDSFGVTFIACGVAAVVQGGGADQGEVYAYHGCKFANGGPAFNGGGGGQIDCLSCHIDYCTQIIVNMYADFNFVGGWVENNAMQTAGNGPLIVIQYGRSSFQKCQFLNTNTTVASGNNYLFTVNGTASLSFDDVDASNWTTAGTNNSLNNGTSPLVLLGGKVTLNGFSGIKYITRGTGQFVDMPMTTIASSGSAQTLQLAANGHCGFDLTLTGNCAITLDGSIGAISGEMRWATIIIRSGAGGFTPSFTNTVYWRDLAPAFSTAAGVAKAVTIGTDDNGTTWVER